MAGRGATGDSRQGGPGDGLFQLVRRLIDIAGHLVFLWAAPRIPLQAIPRLPSPCPGPMAYFIVTDHLDLAECEACGYIAVSGTVYDIAHLNTPHNGRLAT